MIRTHSIQIRVLCILFGGLLASAAFGEEATKGTATSPPPPAEQRKGIFDAIKDLFSSESAEEKTTRPGVANWRCRRKPWLDNQRRENRRPVFRKTSRGRFRQVGEQNPNHLRRRCPRSSAQESAAACVARRGVVFLVSEARS